MYDAQSPCLAEGQRNIVFIHQHLYILKSAHLTKRSGALKKKKSTWNISYVMAKMTIICCFCMFARLALQDAR